MGKLTGPMESSNPIDTPLALVAKSGLHTCECHSVSHLIFMKGHLGHHFRKGKRSKYGEFILYS